MFDREYMDYHSDRFIDHSLMFYRDGKPVALLPANEKDSRLQSHGGLTYGGMIVGSDMRQTVMLECFLELKAYCMDNGISGIFYKTIPDIFHTQPAEEEIYALYRFGAVPKKVEASTAINLENPLRLSDLRKRQIKKARKEGVEILIDDSPETFHRFMKMQDAVLSERHGVHAVHTGDEMQLLHERFPDRIHLFAARKDNELLGGSIVFVYDTVVHTQYLCANEEAKRTGALDAAVDTIIRHYQGKKKWLDFGISTENNGYVLNEGLIAQKEGFGGRTIVYRSWELDFA
ncbi:MAG: GNAT family N-acetyltransferase [Lachnospiraceae bacterium]|nr:GNAT family N-acetyltransferase [Lachnospiraceae bacterium]